VTERLTARATSPGGTLSASRHGGASSGPAAPGPGPRHQQGARLLAGRSVRSSVGRAAD
jgi:hypothetical protein